MLATSSIFCARITAGPRNTLNGGPYHPLFQPDSAAMRWLFMVYIKKLDIREIIDRMGGSDD
jgi:hypothetical protein